MKNSIPEILRWIGMIILVAAGASFLFDGWHVMTPLVKYLSFCGFTLLLTCMGMVCRTLLKEQKGERAFFGMAAASLSAHFAQLGAILFSLEGVQINFIAGTTTAILLTLPIAYLGFPELQKEERRVSWFFYILLNSLLLWPVRQGTVMIILTLLSLTAFLLMNRWLSKRQVNASVSRLLLSIPLAVLLCRTLLYSQPNYVTGIVWISVGTLLFFISVWLKIPPKQTVLFQFISFPFFSVGLFEIGKSLSELFPPAYWSYSNLLPQALALIALSFFSEKSAENLFRNLGAISAAVVLLCALAFGTAPLATLITITVGACFIPMGLFTKSKSLVLSGSSSMLLGIAYQIWASIEFLLRSPWITLATLGFFILILAVYLEKNEEKTVIKLRSAIQKFSEWK